MQINNFVGDLMKYELENWTTNKISTLEFKQFLIEKYPQFYWRQEEVSKFLSQSEYPFVDNGVFRTYTIKHDGFYFSESSKDWVEIATMQPDHAKNALLKHWGEESLEDLLDNKTSTPFLLLKRYVTNG